MDSVINSRGRKRSFLLADLAQPLAAALVRGPVPLLVLRLPEFERIAWRDGKRSARRLERLTTHAFERAARAALRKGDLTAHDAGSDVFTILMAAPSRESRLPSPADCRSVLERIAAAISLSADLRIETGWSLIRRFDPQTGLDEEIANALERGARERERYEFFAAIGHELRTPLTSIRGYLETLIESEMDAATARRFLETAQKEALRMGRLIDGMFEFSLLDLSADALGGRDCRIDERLELACEVVRPLARSRGIRICCATSQAVHAAIDADAALQLFVNLLDNAIKYGRDDGSVHIEAVTTPADAIVCVDDDGPGIAPSDRESIFGLRVRGSEAGSRPGTGIGLAIVKMIAERAGGSIRVCESTLGGARFEVRLPRAESAVCVS
jgi:signal transduction histidine kinase